jgi:chitin synthase
MFPVATADKSRMMHDKKIIGCCGETSITNAKQSIVTMAQVRG